MLLRKRCNLRKSQRKWDRIYTVPDSGSYFSYIVFKKIKDLCFSKKFDVVHIHSFNTIFSILLTLKFVKVPVVATRHIYVEHVKKDIFHKWYLGRIDKMLAISDFSRCNIIDTYPISEEKIETLYLGIDLKKYIRDGQKAKEFKKQFSISDDKKVVGVIGRIDPAKGQLEFINSIPEIIKEYPKTHFVIVGKTTATKELEYLYALKNRIQDLGIGSYVTFTGFYSDVSYPCLLWIFL